MSMFQEHFNKLINIFPNDFLALEYKTDAK